MRTGPGPKTSRRSGSAEAAAARLLGALGLSARAGRVELGAEAAERAVHRGEAAAILVAGDAPERIRRRFRRLLRERPADCKVVLDGERLGRALGSRRVVVVALTDVALGRKVLALADALEV